MKLLTLLIYLSSLSLALSQDYVYPHSKGIPIENYEQRRLAALKGLSENTCLVLFSGDFFYGSSLSNKFRQNGWFYYFTGISRPNMVLILSPKGIKIEGKAQKEIIIFDEANEQDIKWHGPDITHKLARTFFKIDKASGLEKFDDVFDKVLRSSDTLIIPYPADFQPNPMGDFISQIQDEAGDNKKIVLNQHPAINRIRGIKEPAEIQLIKKAVDITGKSFVEVIKNVKRLSNEREIEALMEYNFRSSGAEMTAFQSIVGAGANSCYYHYCDNNSDIKVGELILLDCGSQYMGYSSDISRTIPKSGTFTEEQKTIYNIVLGAHAKALEKAKPGESFMAPHMAAANYIAEKLLDLGIIKEKQDYIKYFNHGTSHYMGIEAHDAGDFSQLKEGVVMTIEPGIYIIPGSDCDKKWHGIGIRIEDDILITKDGYEILSSALPRNIDEIENLMENAQ